ncbi:hypothetical protein D3C79_617790 [compost metagenome]
MRFIQHHQIPGNGLDVLRLGFGELIRAEHWAVGEHKRVSDALLAKRVVALGFQNQTLQIELVLQLLVPLLAQVGRSDDQDAPTTLGPALRDDQPSLDRLTQAHLVSQDYPT